MRASQFADRVHHVEERLTALKNTLRKAHMPSTAVGEIARLLRVSAHELEVTASDLDDAQAAAAARHRQELHE
jgi:hypothetical protein